MASGRAWRGGIIGIVVIVVHGVFAVLESGNRVVALHDGGIPFRNGGIALEECHVTFSQSGFFLGYREISFLNGGIAFRHDCHYLLH